MTTDTTTLRALLTATPDDWGLRRVYADALDDGSGEGAMLANGQRWQARKRKYPADPELASAIMWKATDSYLWHYSRRTRRSHFGLTQDIIKRLTGANPRNCSGLNYFAPTPDAAEAALARALWSLGIQGAT